MSLDLWLAFVAASTALLLVPGPTVLLVLSYALSQGRRVALATAGGVALGDLVAMSASLLGLGALVLASATAFTLLKWIGAAYLFYLGVRLLTAPPPTGLDTLPDAAPAVSAGRVFGHTAAVTALNPKSISFFIAFVPHFIDPGAPLLPQFVLLITTFVALAALNAAAYALLADRLRRAIGRPAVLTALTRMGGLTLIGMGVLTATLRRANA